MLKKIIELYSDKEYFVNIFKIGWPITLQQLAFAALNLLGVVFVGQKGEELVKWALGLYRYRTRKWINNLALQV